MICDPFGLLKILGAFVLCSIIGWFICQPASLNKRALQPTAYNISGQEVEAYWKEATFKKVVDTKEALNFTPQPLGGNCRMQKSLGTVVSVTIIPKDKQKYQASHEEDFVWRAKEEYDKWLKEELPKHLKDIGADREDMEKWKKLIDEHLLVRNGDAAFDYPVIILNNNSHSQKPH